jgi:hypothetical protein
MSAATWLRTLPTRTPCKPARAARRPALRPRLEHLEDRALPSFGFGWAFNFGGGPGTFTSGEGIATDAAGNVYTTGYFNSPSVNFNPSGGTPYVLQRYSNVTSYPSDIFVSELTAGGDFAAAAHFGGSSAGTGIDNIALDGSANVYLTGRFYGTANFSPNGTYNLASSGNQDAFVSKLTQTGTKQAQASRFAPAVSPAVTGPAAAAPAGLTTPADPAPTVGSQRPAAVRAPLSAELPDWLGVASPRKRPSLLFADWFADAV